MAERFDVVVIGGGVVGASTAYHLAALSDARVALVERAQRQLGSGLAHGRPRSRHQRSGRRDALVQHANLACQGEHDQGKRDDADPQEDVRDDERFDHLPSPNAASCV